MHHLREEQPYCTILQVSLPHLIQSLPLNPFHRSRTFERHTHNYILSTSPEYWVPKQSSLTLRPMWVSLYNMGTSNEGRRPTWDSPVWGPTVGGDPPMEGPALAGTLGPPAGLQLPTSPRGGGHHGSHPS